MGLPIEIHAVGKLKEKFFQEAEAMYCQRLAPYHRLSILEHKTDKEIAHAMATRSHVLALDEKGGNITTIEFAKLLADHAMFAGGAPLTFAIGGADGHKPEVRKASRTLISFGKMTIAHRLVRIVLLEQIYRASRINRGEPYHRE